MNRLIVILIFALASTACGISIDLPVTDVKTGPTHTDEILVPLPGDATETVHLKLTFGAGEMNLTHGASDALVSGTVIYNVSDFKPVITEDGNEISIESGSLEIKGIPYFSKNIKNIWDLKLAAVPMDLVIGAGAYQGKMELGGLALKSLHVTDGASEVRLKFSEPNQVEMDTFQYETGASDVELTGLANANFETLVFKSGAGDYTLDFSGELRRDATVMIDSGVSSITIIVPEGVSARVFFDGALSNIDLNGAWEKSGDVYIQEGTGPRLTINVNMAAGTVDLRTE